MVTQRKWRTVLLVVFVCLCYLMRYFTEFDSTQPAYVPCGNTWRVSSGPRGGERTLLLGRTASKDNAIVLFPLSVVPKISCSKEGSRLACSPRGRDCHATDWRWLPLLLRDAPLPCIYADALHPIRDLLVSDKK